MKDIEKIVRFCNSFHKYNIPKLKFKVLNPRYQDLYRNLYKTNEEDINKASFIVFLSCLIVSIVLSVLVTPFNLLIIFLYSSIFSLVFSYKFNSILYRDIAVNESILNSILYIIKIDYSLTQNTAASDSDKCLNFIELMLSYKIPVLTHFKSILRRVHEGKNPERELYELQSPSSDFDNFIKYLLSVRFDTYDAENFTESSLESRFKIYLKQVQSKISILFFIGLFFPVGLCFLILFQLIHVFFLLFFIPFFLIALNRLFKKFIRNQTYLIGLINDFSGLERKKFEEFLLILRSFANNLKSNISPEKALIESYNQNKNSISILTKLLKTNIFYLLNFSLSFNEIINLLKSELKSWRYIIILDALRNFIDRSAYFTSDKITEILTIIYNHQKLENKLNIIMKGENFKIFFFLFLLPIITGAISGFFPFYTIISNNLNLTGNIFTAFIQNSPNIYNIGIIFIVLMSTISITTNYFLKLIHHIRRIPIILGANLMFILVFIISFINIVSFI